GAVVASAPTVLQAPAKTETGEIIPRAVAVNNVGSARPVLMKEPTVLGIDPYNSDRSVSNAIAKKALDGQIAPVDSSGVVPAPKAARGDQIEVSRALPAGRAAGLRNSTL